MKQIPEKYKPWYRGAQALILLLVAYFLGKHLYASREQLRAAIVQIRVIYLLLSLLLSVICGVLVAIGWSLILRAMGKEVPHLRMLKIYYLSELGRYLPGKVWAVMGRLLMAEKEGIPKVMTLASIGTQMIIQVISSMLIVLIALPFTPLLNQKISSQLYYFFFIIPLGLIVLHPKFFNPLLNWMLKYISKTALTATLRYRNILLLVGYWCWLWFIKGWAAYALLIAVCQAPLPSFALINTVGVSAFSWLGGVLVFVVPAGLGVTEGIIATLFSFLFSIDLGIAAAVAVLCRVVSIVAEIITIGAIFLLEARGKFHSSR